jgi:hypothetical protein
MPQKFPALSACCTLLAAISTFSAGAAETAHPTHMHAAGPGPSAPPAAFVASTTKPFSSLMDDAMGVMNDGMGRAPMNGNPDHDFASMMIPHHQGAVDMAKAVLLYGKNPVLRRLAQEIIVSQGSEIAVMRAELDKGKAIHTANPTRPASGGKP